MQSIAQRLSASLALLLALAGGAWAQADRFVGQWTLDVKGQSLQRAVAIRRDGDTLRVALGRKEPGARLGPVESSLDEAGVLTITSRADSVIVVKLVDDDTMRGQLTNSGGKVFTATMSRDHGEAPTAGRAAETPGTAAASLAAPAAVAAPVDPGSVLTKAEVQALAAGHVWVIHRNSDNNDVRWDLRAAGNLFGDNRTVNGRDTAAWLVNDEGQLCVKWRGNSRDGCFVIARNGSKYLMSNPKQAERPADFTVE